MQEELPDIYDLTGEGTEALPEIRDQLKDTYPFQRRNHGLLDDAK
jgi:hypothetical protein